MPKQRTVIDKKSELIEYVKQYGRPIGMVIKPKVMQFGNGYAQRKSGQVQFFFRGDFRACARITSVEHRREWMAKKLREVNNLEGEKYFLWQPD